MTLHSNHNLILLFCLTAMLCGCSTDEELTTEEGSNELTGIQAIISGMPTTRAESVADNYVGRSQFIAGDNMTLTEIQRTVNPLTNFTYHNISWSANSNGAWARTTTTPERIYWSDATSAHTFIGFSTPQGETFAAKWKSYTFESGENKGLTFYFGTLGDTSSATDLDFTDNDKMKAEDLLLTYSKEVTAEPGGSIALIKFRHGLSNIKVVVNISGFSADKNAADTKSVVSDMIVLSQPTVYQWKQTGDGTQTAGQSEQSILQELLGSDVNYNNTRNIKTWNVYPDGSGDSQGRTFTFHCLTVPHECATTDTTKFRFNVTYPDPLNPSVNKTHAYTASIAGLNFKAGYCTVVNITLNHRNEKMTVGAQYTDWQFVATPDNSNLYKNSTFLDTSSRDSVTIVGDAKATADDATWLYEKTSDGKVYDIYGNDGSSEAKAYRISTARQLLSFAYEVLKGRDFSGSYVRLDADITLQPTTDATSNTLAWQGIGDATHPFNGTFMCGQRYIYRLMGNALFAYVGAKGSVQRLQVTTSSLSGNGAVAERNDGLLQECKIDGDAVSTPTGNFGSLVGTNNGIIYASYHIGTTQAPTAAGGLVGTNNGTVVGCYQAGAVSATTTYAIAATMGSDGKLIGNYYDKAIALAAKNHDGTTGLLTSEMIKPAFVTNINKALTDYKSSYAGTIPPFKFAVYLQPCQLSKDC
ncbi:MAG: fimbrillin family protein [Prevotella sp.]